jgi:hypothetical protein
MLSDISCTLMTLLSLNNFVSGISRRSSSVMAQFPLSRTVYRPINCTSWEMLSLDCVNPYI